MRPRLAALWIGLALVSFGCKDRGADAFARADAQYRALAEQGKPAHDPGFTEVMDLLAQVPGDSPFSERARRLERAIEQARKRRPPLPLATGGHGASDGGIEALMDACEQLARKLGDSQYEAERKALEQRLLKCRATVFELRDKAHHEATPGDEGGRTR